VEPEHAGEAVQADTDKDNLFTILTSDPLLIETPTGDTMIAPTPDVIRTLYVLVGLSTKNK
jgi:hypothetical protein